MGTHLFFFYVMAKRFLDTGFYKSPFVRSLQAPYKALYQFMICDCSPAGIWVVDFEAAKMYTGFPVDRAIAEDKFLSTGKAVHIGDGRWFIPGFIRHQYPKGLQAENPAHKNIIAELKSYSLITNELELSIQDPSKDLPRPFKGSKDKVMVMEEVMVKDKVKVKDARDELILPFETETFKQAWAGWNDYRKVELRKTWKSPKSEQIALNKLGRDAGNEETAIAMIEQSIANQYQGLFELKTSRNEKQPTPDQKYARALARYD